MSMNHRIIGVNNAMDLRNNGLNISGDQRVIDTNKSMNQ